MIVFLTRREHRLMVNPLCDGPGASWMSYDTLFARKRMPYARYVFCDLDRLSAWELELAGRAFACMKRAGFPVVNEPAAVKLRYPLLRALKREGINPFNAYRVGSDEWPERYPVFLRRERFHDGVFGDLLDDRVALEAAIEDLRRTGVPQEQTLIVEYAAEPRKADSFAKYSIYRLGDRFFRDTTVTQREWSVKAGDVDAAGANFYAKERAWMDELPSCFDVIRRAFEIARIEYGRLDYGLLDDKPVIYEINTNPEVSFSLEHPSADRVESRRIFVRNFKAALKAFIPDGSGPRVKLVDSVLRTQRKREKCFQQSRATN